MTSLPWSRKPPWLVSPGMGELGALDLYVPGNTPQTTPERKAYVLTSVPKATQNGETTANFDVSSENQQDFLKQIISASVTNHNVTHQLQTRHAVKDVSGYDDASADEWKRGSSTSISFAHSDHPSLPAEAPGTAQKVTLDRTSDLPPQIDNSSILTERYSTVSRECIPAPVLHSGPTAQLSLSLPGQASSSSPLPQSSSVAFPQGGMKDQRKDTSSLPMTSTVNTFANTPPRLITLTPNRAVVNDLSTQQQPVFPMSPPPFETPGRPVLLHQNQGGMERNGTVDYSEITQHVPVIPMTPPPWDTPHANRHTRLRGDNTFGGRVEPSPPVTTKAAFPMSPPPWDTPHPDRKMESPGRDATSSEHSEKNVGHSSNVDLNSRLTWNSPPAQQTNTVQTSAVSPPRERDEASQPPGSQFSERSGADVGGDPARLYPMSPPPWETPHRAGRRVTPSRVETSPAQPTRSPESPNFTPSMPTLPQDLLDMFGPGALRSSKARDARQPAAHATRVDTRSLVEAPSFEPQSSSSETRVPPPSQEEMFGSSASTSAAPSPSSCCSDSFGGAFQTSSSTAEEEEEEEEEGGGGDQFVTGRSWATTTPTATHSHQGQPHEEPTTPPPRLSSSRKDESARDTMARWSSQETSLVEFDYEDTDEGVAVCSAGSTSKARSAAKEPRSSQSGNTNNSNSSSSSNSSSNNSSSSYDHDADAAVNLGMLMTTFAASELPSHKPTQHRASAKVTHGGGGGGAAAAAATTKNADTRTETASASPAFSSSSPSQPSERVPQTPLPSTPVQQKHSRRTTAAPVGAPFLVTPSVLRQPLAFSPATTAAIYRRTLDPPPFVAAAPLTPPAPSPAPSPPLAPSPPPAPSLRAAPRVPSSSGAPPASVPESNKAISTAATGCSVASSGSVGGGGGGNSRSKWGVLRAATKRQLKPFDAVKPQVPWQVPWQRTLRTGDEERELAHVASRVSGLGSPSSSSGLGFSGLGRDFEEEQTQAVNTHTSGGASLPAQTHFFFLSDGVTSVASPFAPESVRLDFFRSLSPGDGGLATSRTSLPPPPPSSSSSSSSSFNQYLPTMIAMSSGGGGSSKRDGDLWLATSQQQPPHHHDTHPRSSFVPSASATHRSAHLNDNPDCIYCYLPLEDPVPLEGCGHVVCSLCRFVAVQVRGLPRDSACPRCPIRLRHTSSSREEEGAMGKTVAWASSSEQLPPSSPSPLGLETTLNKQQSLRKVEKGTAATAAATAASLRETADDISHHRNRHHERRLRRRHKEALGLYRDATSLFIPVWRRAGLGLYGGTHLQSPSTYQQQQQQQQQQHGYIDSSSSSSSSSGGVGLGPWYRGLALPFEALRDLQDSATLCREAAELGAMPQAYHALAEAYRAGHVQCDDDDDDDDLTDNEDDDDEAALGSGRDEGRRRSSRRSRRRSDGRRRGRRGTKGTSRERAALYWEAKAARMGHPVAMFLIGLAHEEGVIKPPPPPQHSPPPLKSLQSPPSSSSSSGKPKKNVLQKNAATREGGGSSNISTANKKGGDRAAVSAAASASLSSKALEASRRHRQQLSELAEKQQQKQQQAQSTRDAHTKESDRERRERGQRRAGAEEEEERAMRAVAMEAEAVKWYRASACKGCAQAQLNLGACLWSGRGGVPEDKFQAVEWFLKAATSPQPQPASSVGLLASLASSFPSCVLGTSLPPSSSLFLPLSSSASHGGDHHNHTGSKGLAEAQFNLGVAFWLGQGVERRSCSRAVRWFSDAARQGHSRAAYHLGSAFKNGEGVKRDMGAAAYWWSKAACSHPSLGGGVSKPLYFDPCQTTFNRSGGGGSGVVCSMPEAANNLGTALWNGEIVGSAASSSPSAASSPSPSSSTPSMRSAAIEWYRLAASQGLAEAQLHLASALLSTSSTASSSSSTQTFSTFANPSRYASSTLLASSPSTLLASSEFSSMRSTATATATETSTASPHQKTPVAIEGTGRASPSPLLSPSTTAALVSPTPETLQPPTQQTSPENSKSPSVSESLPSWWLSPEAGQQSQPPSSSDHTHNSPSTQSAPGRRSGGDSSIAPAATTAEVQEAALWFRAAAEQGEAEACHSLGVLYEYRMIGGGQGLTSAPGSGLGGGIGAPTAAAASPSVGKERERGGAGLDEDDGHLSKALMWYSRAVALGFQPSEDALRSLQKETPPPQLPPSPPPPFPPPTTLAFPYR